MPESIGAHGENSTIWEILSAARTRHISRFAPDASPKHQTHWTIEDFRLCIDGKSSGAVRVSVSLASNVAEIEDFLALASEFVGRGKSVARSGTFRQTIGEILQ